MTGPFFGIYEIPDVDVYDFEHLGTKRKFWIRDTSWFRTGSRPILFKEGRERTGENWAEKVACELCSLIQLPHAHYELAKCKDMEGVISEDFVPDSANLIHGNELLSKFTPHYEKSLRKQKKYTLNRVCALLNNEYFLYPTSPYTVRFESAMDAFIGYILFDAWIGNQDRHHENWGLIESPQGFHLTPSFDQASSLGREGTDDRRRSILSNKDQERRGMIAYANRSKTPFYNKSSDTKPLTTIEAAEIISSKKKETAIIWLKAIEEIEEDSITSIFNRIPKPLISDVAIEFAIELLNINKKKLMDLRRRL